MKYIILLLTIVAFMLGCSARSVPINPGKIYDDLDKTVAEDNARGETIEDKEKKVADLQARLGAAESDLKSAKKALEAERLRRMQTIAYWTAGLCMLVGFGCVAALIILAIQGIHIGRKLIVGIGVASFAVGAVALFAGKYIEYWQWVGGVILLGGLAYGAWYLHRILTINKETTKVGVDALWELMQIRDMETNGEDKASAVENLKAAAAKAVDDIKDSARKRQAKKGVYTDINKIIQPHKLRHHVPEKLVA